MGSQGLAIYTESAYCFDCFQLTELFQGIIFEQILYIHILVRIIIFHKQSVCVCVCVHVCAYVRMVCICVPSMMYTQGSVIL